MSSGKTYAYHWALVEWPDGKGQQHVQVVRTTKGRDAASEAAWTWAHKHLAPGALRQANVRYLGRSDTRTRY
ncbi:hypothetical protein AB0L75_16335 [Streptomyces sp. NPDC052101]|uniref:hypothetical protein n=1 Tax=Streptomyces sp. NPDC052101 TaxID=3155763 RepID=UPI0034204963